MSRKSAYDATVRAAVDARDDGQCRRCGARGGLISRHHRIPRGMGGANRAHAGRLSVIVTLCGSGTTGCHGWVEQHREEAREGGWLLYPIDDPEQVPIIGLNGPLWLLDDGSVTYRSPEERA